MSRNRILSTIVLAAAIILLMYWFVEGRKPEAPDLSLPPAGDITVRGETGCLPKKRSGGIQTLECAFGIKGDDGRYYALNDPDPNYRNLGSVPSGSRVEIAGAFVPESGDNYDSVGTITVNSISIIDR